MEAVHALQPLLVLLSAGLLAMLIMPPLGLSPVVGYLLAGMMLGEYGLHIIEDSSTTHLLAELGVVFLLFDIGLHFSPRHIWEARRDIFGLGPLQMLICSVGIGVSLWLWTDLNYSVAVLVGASLALSSTAVASQTLIDSGQQRAPLGKSATAVLVFQDICAIFLLVLASSLTSNGDISVANQVGWAFLKSVIAFAGAMLIGNYFLGPFFNLVAKAHQRGIFTTTALLVVLAAAATTGAAGLSLTLGAFLAGMIVSTTDYRHAVRTEMEPFRGLLIGFFFITVGMKLDYQQLLENRNNVLLILSALIIIKTLLIYISARLMAQRHAFSMQISSLLSQGSEFAFVILALPGVSSLVAPELSDEIITAVALSMALTAPLTYLVQKLAKSGANKAWEKRAGEYVGTSTGNAEVIILGMNKAGRLLADVLSELGRPYKAFDYQHDRFVKARIDGYPVAFGDLADLRLMETLQMSDAKVLAVCEPRTEIAQEVGPALRRRYPKLKVYVAVANELESRNYPNKSAIAVICNSLPRGIDLSGAVLAALEVDPDFVASWFKRKLNQELNENSIPEVEPQTTA